MTLVYRVQFVQQQIVRRPHSETITRRFIIIFRMIQPTANPEAFPKRTLKPISKQMMLGIVVGMVLFLVVPGVFFGWVAFSPDESLWGRILLLVVGACFLFLPVRTAWVHLRRRWTKGHWLIANDERLEHRAKWARSSTSGWRTFTWLWPFVTVAYSVIACIWWFEVFTRPYQRKYDLFFAAVWTCIAGLVGRNVFRDRKQSKPPANISTDPPDVTQSTPGR